MVASINIRLRAKSAIANGIEKRPSVDVASFRGGVKIQTIDLASKALLLILRKRECRSVVADVFIAQTASELFWAGARFAPVVRGYDRIAIAFREQIESCGGAVLKNILEIGCRHDFIRSL